MRAAHAGPLPMRACVAKERGRQRWLCGCGELPRVQRLPLRARTGMCGGRKGVGANPACAAAVILARGMCVNAACVEPCPTNQPTRQPAGQPASQPANNLSTPSRVCPHAQGGRTPLHLAAAGGHAECAKALLTAGRGRLQLHARDADGRTAHELVDLRTRQG
eukprot:6386-Chlamydomonas_euryale.AAC.1